MKSATTDHVSKWLGVIISRTQKNSKPDVPDNYRMIIVENFFDDDELVLTLVREFDGAEVTLTETKLQSFIDDGILIVEKRT